MNKKLQFIALLLATALPIAQSNAATSFTDPAAIGSWNTNRWNNSADSSPYTTSYTSQNDVSFTNGNSYSIAGMGSNISVGNVSVANNTTVTFTLASGTFQTSSAVRTLTIGTNAILDFGGQSLATAAGTGFIKNGAGILAAVGASYGGGFTLNAGTVISEGVNAMGNGALTINGGTLAANANRAYTGQFSSFTIGGDFTFGAVTAGVASGNGSATANISIDTAAALGAATRTITIGSNANYSLLGILSGSAGTGLTVAASGGATGILTLGGGSANTLSGTTTVNSGELDLSKTSGNAVAGNATVNGGILKLVNANQIADASTLSVAGGTFDISANSETVGSVVLSSGSITGTSGILTSTGGYDVRSGSVSAILGGSGALTKSTGGTVTLSGVNTYGGLTTVTAGTLSVGANAPSGSAGALGNATSAVLLGDTAAGSTGNATLQTAGAFTVGRDITVRALGAGGTQTAQIGGSTAASSTFSGAIALNRNLTVDAVNGATVNLTKSINNASGSNTVNITGAGTGNVVLNNGTADQFAPTAFSVNSGKLSLGASNQIANSTNVAVNGGTLDIAGSSDQVGAVTLASGNINGSGGTLTGSSYGVQSGSISGKLGGSGALTKSTSGTVILTGVASYSGGTNISGGILQLNANDVLPDTGTVTLSGGTLQLNGKNEGTSGATGAGALSLTSSSTIDLTSTSLIHFLASNGLSATWAGNTLSILNWSGTATLGGGLEELKFGSNNTALTQSQLDAINFYSGGTTLSGFLGTGAWATNNPGEVVPTAPTAVPEPSTWIVAAMAAAVIGYMSRRSLTAKADQLFATANLSFGGLVVRRRRIQTLKS